MACNESQCEDMTNGLSHGFCANVLVVKYLTGPEPPPEENKKGSWSLCVTQFDFLSLIII